MSTWNNIEISSFLTERKNRFKPAEANELGLKRLYKIDFSGKIHLLEGKQTNTNMILIKKGDLVISGINVEKGAVSIYQGDEDVLATIHYSSYGFDKSQIDIDYFKWFLKSRTFKEVMQSQVRGGIKTELKPKHFLPLKIDLPDLPTQENIRDRINNISKEINEMNHFYAQNENYVNKLCQAIFQEAVQGKIISQNPNDEPASVLLKKIKEEKEKMIKEKKIRKDKFLPPIKEEEIPFELPSGWDFVRIIDVCYKITDGTHHTPRYVEEGVPFLSIKDIDFGKISYNSCRHITSNEHKELIKRCKPEKNDLLFCRIGTLGRCALIRDDREFSIFVSLGLIKFFTNFIDKDYFEQLMNSPIMYKQYLEIKAGGLHTNKLNLTDMPKLIIPIPPLNEQKRIVEKIDQLMKLCDELKIKVKENQKNANLLMEAVLREAFEVKV